MDHSVEVSGGRREGRREQVNLHAESCEVISVVPIFPAFPAFQAPFRLLALHPPFGCFPQVTGALLAQSSSLLLLPDHPDGHEPSRHTHTLVRTPRASATKPAVPPFALPAARRHPVTILSICAFLSVPILSYFFLAPNGTTTTLSYITYTESSAPPLRLHLSRVLFYQEVVLLLNSLYIQKTKTVCSPCPCSHSSLFVPSTKSPNPVSIQTWITTRRPPALV